MTTVRCFLSCAVFLAIAGCAPANYVRQSEMLTAPCEISVCSNRGASPARCGCTTYGDVSRRMKEIVGARD